MGTRLCDIHLLGPVWCSASCAGGKPATSRCTPSLSSRHQAPSCDTLRVAGGLREHSTPGTVQARHRKGDASRGLEVRLSEHGKRSPGAPQGESGCRQGRDAGLGQPVELEAGAQSQGGFDGAARSSLSLSFWAAPRRRRCPLPSARPSLPLHPPQGSAGRPEGRQGGQAAWAGPCLQGYGR